MKTIFRTSNLIPLILGVFLTLRLVGADKSENLSETSAITGTTRSVLAADSTSILGLFGLATALNGLGKRKIGVKKA